MGLVHPSQRANWHFIDFERDVPGYESKRVRYSSLFSSSLPDFMPRVLKNRRARGVPFLMRVGLRVSESPIPPGRRDHNLLITTVKTRIDLYPGAVNYSHQQADADKDEDRTELREGVDPIGIVKNCHAGSCE